jgi:hypothetical protein
MTALNELPTTPQQAAPPVGSIPTPNGGMPLPSPAFNPTEPFIASAPAPLQEQDITNQLTEEQPVQQQPVQQQQVQQPVQQQPVQQTPVDGAAAMMNASQQMGQPAPQPAATQPTQQPIAQPAQQPINTLPQGANPVTAFAPPLQDNQRLVCKMSPAKFDAFVKVLTVLDDKNVIVIEQSNICQSINNGSAILVTDISNLIDGANNKIDLHILSPKKYIKFFKNFKGDSDIYIIDDMNNQRYIVTNGDLSLYLPKQIEAFEKDATPPDLSTCRPIGVTLEIDKDVRSTIMSMSSETSHVDLLIHDSQFKGVYIPETAVFTFKQFIKDQIDDTRADLRLRAFAFLKVPGDEYKVTLGELNNTHWIITLVNTGFVVVSIIECLQSVTDENLII